MEKKEYDNYIQLFKQRKTECLVHQEAYDIWLSVLTPIRWVSIAIGVIFPAVVGVTMFSERYGDEWKLWSAIILLISGIVSGLHVAFNCDAHQLDCQRLKKRYEALADKYNDAIYLKPADIKQVQQTLGNNLKELKEDSITSPAKWCFDKAKKKITP